ncbi:exosome complex exonuclease RRP46, putative [Entamoeba invadens IP1]|uniref:exosome complex exonuclease RRP46, putative n=1 Tax=Entamoeba invadens IP1 TaxID=370355 RepID=UPI0002C3D4AE|nr:exosome complex exonuclease RRP46, putative [Entamoeba invadens IP1]ELP93173.1 exosome complex exonuclease RRP46, putative [Entamoeba invadens IP1]|eukprot:XP_004259944.1 exosome complex exonuclease RRP46, putative [Entamoeba invadens IP1]
MQVEVTQQTTAKESGKIRALSYQREVNTKSDGCYMFHQGKTCVIAGVNAPRNTLKSKEQPNTAYVDVQFYEKVAAQQGKRKTELEEFVRSGVEWAVLCEKYPRGLINVCIQTVKDDGCVESVGMNATMTSLLYSGVDMKSIVVGMCVAGFKNANGQYEIVVDANDSREYQWRVFSAWDLTTNAMAAMKMKGKCTDDQLKQSLEISSKNAAKMLRAIKTVIEKQYPL